MGRGKQDAKWSGNQVNQSFPKRRDYMSRPISSVSIQCCWQWVYLRWMSLKCMPPQSKAQCQALTFTYGMQQAMETSFGCCYCSFAKWCDDMYCSTPGSSRSLLKFMSFESVMLSRHLILYSPLLLLPSILPSIRVFSSKSALLIRWPKY